MHFISQLCEMEIIVFLPLQEAKLPSSQPDCVARDHFISF